MFICKKYVNLQTKKRENFTSALYNSYESVAINGASTPASFAIGID